MSSALKLNESAELPIVPSAQGRPHSFAKMSAATVLGDFFDRLGRPVYLACELPVLYPGEAPFAPDLMAVVGIEDPGAADTREGWVVTEEGRGPDLILEILYKGDRDKDLVSNVARYARLEIPEYFVYDVRWQRLYGYRLSSSGGYVNIAPRGVQLRSTVLGLDLGIERGRLHFYIGGAQVPETRQVLARLERQMGINQSLLDDRDRQLLVEASARYEAEARAEAEATARRALEAELAALRAQLAGR